MSEAMELYEQARKYTGIDNDEEALNAYVSSDFGYSNDDYSKRSETLEKGDTVRLKSGGPLMTITDIDGSAIACSWFDNARVQTVKLFPILLVLVDTCPYNDTCGGDWESGMDEIHIDVGYTVKLASGGPVMTVDADDYREGGEYENRIFSCIWFDNRNMLRSARFNALTLTWDIENDKIINIDYDNSLFMANCAESDIQTIESVDNIHVHDTFFNMKNEIKNETKRLENVSEITKSNIPEIVIDEDVIPF